MRLASSQPLSGRSGPRADRLDAIEERGRHEDARDQRAHGRVVIEVRHRARLLVERAQARLLVGRQRPAPCAAGECERIGHLAGLRQRLRSHHLVVVRAQRLDVRSRRSGQRGNLRGIEILDLAAAQLQPEVIGQHAEVRVVVRPRSEQIVPRLIQPRAIRAVDHVLGEELVVALVLHLQHERVVLGAVVGVVERRRNRILVGRIRFAVRVRRQQRRRTRRCSARNVS